MQCCQKYTRHFFAVIITLVMTCLFFVMLAFGQSEVNHVFLPTVLNNGSPSITTDSPTATPTATQSATDVQPTPTQAFTATSTPVATHTATFVPTAPAATSTPTRTPTSTGAATSTPTATLVPTSAAVIQANDSWFTDSIGKLHIVGEILNTGVSNVQLAKVTANVFNSSDQLVGVGSTFAYASVIPPGVHACFHVYMDQPSNWTHYQLEGTNFTGGADAPGLIVFNVSTSTGSLGEPKILGQVRNDGATTANSVIVAGTLYNLGQTVIGCDFAYVSSTNLNPGQTSSFAISFYPHTYPPINSYRLQVHGDPQ